MNTNKRQIVINYIVLILMFAGYALTFMVPKFYGATDKYVGVFVFLMCAVLLVNNVDIISLIKKRDMEFIALAVLIVLTGVNLLIVDSGKGAFFVAANFAMVWYMSDKLYLTKRQIIVMASLYMGLLLYWLFIAYPKMFADYEFYAYNTNTAATFTIFTLLCAFILLQILSEKYEIMGLFMVMILLKGFQLVMWHRARGAFIMLLMFIFFRFIALKKWWSSKKMFSFLTIMATFGSLIFVLCYVLLGTTGVNFQIPFFYKPVFSGRNRIWYEFWTLFMKKPLTGVGTNIELESFWEFNVHNAMYNLLVVYGIIVFALMMYLIYKKLFKFSKTVTTSPLALCALAAVMAVFFESYFDVDLIWADYSLNMIFLLSVVGHVNTEKSEEKSIG